MARKVEGLIIKTAEELGKLVREVWIQWAREQPTIKEHWLTPWECLSESDKEVDRRIGLAIQADAHLAGELAGMTEAAKIVTNAGVEQGDQYGSIVLVLPDAQRFASKIINARDDKSLAAKEGK